MVCLTVRDREASSKLESATGMLSGARLCRLTGPRPQAPKPEGRSGLSTLLWQISIDQVIANANVEMVAAFIM